MYKSGATTLPVCPTCAMAGARTSHAKAACCASRRRAREPGSRWARSRRRPRRGSRRPLRPAYPRAVGRHRAREARGCQPRPRRPGGRKRGARARLRSSLSLTLCTCLVEHREVIPRLHATTARDDDARRAEVGPVRFRDVLRDELGKPRVGRRGHRRVGRLHRRARARVLGFLEGGRAHRHNLERVGRFHGRERVARVPGSARARAQK